MPAKICAQLALAMLAASPAVAAAQSDCTGLGATATTLCEAAHASAEIARLGGAVIASGGSPVGGSASTLGMRVGVPRAALSARVAAGRIEVPSVRMNQTDADHATMFYYGVEGAVGLFEGFSPAATVGGVASLDVVASLGRIGLPSGFDGGAGTWSIGLRAGVLRESFTAPGITLSAVYRRLGSLTRGDTTLANSDASAVADGAGVWSLRGVVGKRIAGVGLLAGLGHDRGSTDTHIRAREDGPTATRDIESTTGRTTGFAAISWTSLVYTLSAEAGWQGGAHGRGGTPFGGAAVRITF